MSLLKDFVESQTENLDSDFLDNTQTKELIAARDKALKNFREQLQDSDLKANFELCLEAVFAYSGHGFYWAYEKGMMDIGRLLKELTN